MIEEIIDSKTQCFVCGGELERLHYVNVDDMDGEPDWFFEVATEVDIKMNTYKKLKCCKNCGLVYAK